MPYFWISWWSPDSASELELHFPWWTSGSRNDANAICACVVAADEDAAKQIVMDAYDQTPGEFEWRFVEPQEGTPYSSRFAKRDWMPMWPFAPEVALMQEAVSERSKARRAEGRPPAAPFHRVAHDDRGELREMFAQQNVVVSDVEFEAMFSVQTAMRGMHAILSDQVDATITPQQFLDLSERNASVGFAGFKAILGDDRYRAVFDTDATENLLPIDPDVFLAAHEKDTA